MTPVSLLAGVPESERDLDPGAARARWEAAAAAVLRKAGRLAEGEPDALVWDRLTTTTLDGVRVPPLGTADTVAGLPPTGEPGAAPYTRGSRVRQGWDIRAHHADPDPGSSAVAVLDDLENGATSLWLEVGRGGIAVADLPRVLDTVFLDLAPVSLDCPEDPVGAAEALAALWDERGQVPAEGTVLGLDPVSARLRGGEADVEQVLDRLAALAGLAGRHGVRAVAVDGTAVHDRGATDAQELGYVLAVGVHLLRGLTRRGGLGVAEAAALVELRLAVTDEQLVATAKLRAARRLWHRVLELCGAADAPGAVVHAVTSRAMATRYDAATNLLRGTVAAFAAGVGGADAVTVLPFDAAIGLPVGLSRRLARNTSSLLLHEAHVGVVTDPGGGSFALERLTEDLAGAGWAALQAIEAEGGVLASLDDADGLLGRVREQGARPRAEQVARRSRPLTGVSEFPDPDETPPERRPHPEHAAMAGAERWAAPYERLRDAPATQPVLLATLGPIAQHTARAGFAANLLAAGGVRTVSAGATAAVGDVLAAFAEHGRPPVVCLAGTDAAYAAWGADLVAALREAGARWVLVAGRPGDLAVDDHCVVGVDALGFLGRVRAALEGAR